MKCHHWVSRQPSGLTDIVGVVCMHLRPQGRVFGLEDLRFGGWGGSEKTPSPFPPTPSFLHRETLHGELYSIFCDNLYEKRI